MSRLFNSIARPQATAKTPGAFLGGLRVMAVDGTVLDVPDQELLIKAAAEKQQSVEQLASEILNEAIENKFSEIVTNGNEKQEYSSNPLAKKQPYAYYADPEEPGIPLEDWDRSKNYY